MVTSAWVSVSALLRALEELCPPEEGSCASAILGSQSTKPSATIAARPSVERWTNRDDSVRTDQSEPDTDRQTCLELMRASFVRRPQPESVLPRSLLGSPAVRS